MLFQIGDFSHYTFHEEYMFYNRKPGPVTPLLTLAYPFNGVVWIWVLSSFMFAALAIYLINIKSPISKFHTFQILLSIIVSDTLSDQLLAPLKKNWYGATVLVLWFLCGLLLSASYSSNLLASLLVVEKTRPDNTIKVTYACTLQYILTPQKITIIHFNILKDLVDHKRTFGIPQGTIFQQWLITSPRRIVQIAAEV